MARRARPAAGGGRAGCAPDLDPDLEQISPFAGSYTTAPYPPDVFSDAEYDSPDKQRMIELLGQDRNHRGASGPGAGSH